MPVDSTVEIEISGICGIANVSAFLSASELEHLIETELEPQLTDLYEIPEAVEAICLLINALEIFRS